MKKYFFQNKARVIFALSIGLGIVSSQRLAVAAEKSDALALWVEDDKAPKFSLRPEEILRNAIKSMRTENAEKIDELKRFITERNIDVNTTGDHEITSLAYAVRGDLIETTRMLLEAGADIDYQISSDDSSEDEMTVLCIAAKKNNIDMVKLLLEKKADPNIADFSENTPLKYAIRSKNIEAAKLLADVSGVNAPDDLGTTPLHIAVGTAEPIGLELIKLLLEKGANINAQTYDDGVSGIRTPLSLAADHRNRDVIVLLLERGAIDNAEPSAAAIARKRGDEPFARLIECHTLSLFARMLRCL